MKTWHQCAETEQKCVIKLHIQIILYYHTFINSIMIPLLIIVMSLGYFLSKGDTL